MTEKVVVDVTSDDWEEEVLRSDAPVAVDFWHENCTWCNRLDPIYRQVAKDHQGKIKFAKLHVFRENEIATRYGITGTPTIEFFCAGRESSEICRCGLALPLLLPGTLTLTFESTRSLDLVM